MKRNFQLFFICCGLLAAVAACKKGDPGLTGPAGPAGPTGATGATGSANVIYSPWATLTFAGSGSSWSAKITAPQVSQDIMDKGIVKTYFKFGSAIYEGSYHNQASNAGIYQFLTVGFINLVANFDATYPWRYVIIPGGIPSGRTSTPADPDTFQLQDGSTISRTALDKMSYEEVCKRFSIPMQ